MAIIINIDVMLAKRKMSVTELADKVGITMANISARSIDEMGRVCAGARCPAFTI
jgi:DNA-binding Xre family transcriptional regulator